MGKYIFKKNGSLERPKNISPETFAAAKFGDDFEIYEPQDVQLSRSFYTPSDINTDSYKKLMSLKNTINYYKFYNSDIDYNNFYNTTCSVYYVNSYHLGSGIERGTFNVYMYVSGNLVASGSDSKHDGMIYSGSETIGAVLYNEGIWLLNNSESLGNQSYYNGALDDLRWNYFYSDVTTNGSTYNYQVQFQHSYNIKNYVPTILSFVHTEKKQLNHSNNITYIQSGSYNYSTGSNYFLETTGALPKNTVKSPFVSGSANFEKQTFITNIGLYDEKKKLIGIVNLANPVKVTDNREFIFKLKLDI